MSKRTAGQPQPGINWLKFTLRIPFVHTRVSWPDLLQGLLIAASTALALVPIMTGYFGLTFEEAVALTMVHALLINMSWMVFGEPYASGWITPAIPFVLLFVISESFPTPTERFQVMTALSLDLALILGFLGLTGLGARLINFIPEVLKGAIIFGAAIAAFLSVFDLDQEDNIFHSQPFTVTSALVLSIVLTFSGPIKKWQQRHKWLAVLVSLGLLPGFIIGALVGTYTGELQFDIQSGWIMLPLGSVLEKASPFSIGWPSIDLFLQAFPLALITYVLVFGDLVTGEAVIKEGEDQRKDEELVIDHDRSHQSLSIRNVIMGIIAPFFPTQGILWTGIHVLIIERWKSGRENLDSFFDGVSSYYLFGLPILFFYLPMLTIMQPLLKMALAITLVLTGFACAYIAMAKVHTTTERGCIVLSGIFLALFEPWIGLSLAIVATLVLVDFSKPEPPGEVGE